MALLSLTLFLLAQNSSPIPKWWQRPSATDWAMVGLTLAYVGVNIAILLSLRREIRLTGLAASAASKSADIAERALKLSERADILLDGASIVNPGRPRIDEYSYVLLVFKNFGRTRAKNVIFDSHIITPDTHGPLQPPKQATTMGAGDTVNIRFQTFKETLTQGTFARVMSEHGALRFEGKVTYEDVFGDKHATASSGIYHPNTGSFEVERNEAD